MYNDSRKRRFLERIGDDVRPEFERLFEKVEEMEESYAKDLSEFDLEELTNAFHHLAPERPGRSVKNKEYTQAYIDWSLDQYPVGRVNPLHACDEAWCYQFVTST